jgi:hypothetical protein
MHKKKYLGFSIRVYKIETSSKLKIGFIPEQFVNIFKR